MGKVIEFNSEYFETTNEIKKILFNAVLDSKDNKNEYDYSEDETLEYLENYVLNLLPKLEKRNWLSKEKQQKFIDSYQEITNAKELISKVFYQLEFIYLTDLDPSLLNESNEYIKLMIENLDVYFEEDISITNIQFIKELLSKLKTTPIRNLFKKFDKEDNYTMNDVIELLLRGEDPLAVSVIIKEIDSIVDDDITEGILTIDRVHSYYYEQSTIIAGMRDAAQEHQEEVKDNVEKIYNYKIVDDVNRILYLKRYNEKYKTIFLTLVKEINEMSINLIQNIELVTTLTDILLHYEERIEELDIDTLKTMTFFATINRFTEIDYNELDKIIEDNKPKQSK